MKRYLKINEIVVNRELRQRKEVGDTTDLETSIAKLGLINPVVVDENNVLLAGERRLTACKNLGWEQIPITYKKDLTPVEQQLLELDENLRRRDLHWTEVANAMLRAHELYGGTIENTAENLGHSYAVVNKAIYVGRALARGEEKIQGADGMIAAYNILLRQEERATSASLSEIGELVRAPSTGTQPYQPTPAPAAEQAKQIPQECPIVQGNFLEFAKTYNGKPFNFLHCDFPYGINHHKSDQGNAEEWGSYQDDPDTYWTLCKALCDNKDRLLLPSSHVLFWFSMTFYTKTISFFESAGFVVQPFPLIWHKTDSKGILPDPKRGPRRVYETALLMSLGDRKIVKAVDNTYGCPTSKSLHLSEKPEPMLRHFFRMLVDEFSEVLDPTCGSGNALLAAKRLGANRVFGLELDPAAAEVAQVNFKREMKKDLLAKELA